LVLKDEQENQMESARKLQQHIAHDKEKKELVKDQDSEYVSPSKLQERFDLISSYQVSKSF